MSNRGTSVFADKLLRICARIVEDFVGGGPELEAIARVASVVDGDPDVREGRAVGPAEGGADARGVVVALDRGDAHEADPDCVRDCLAEEEKKKDRMGL